MFSSRREVWANLNIIALVELDLQKRRVRIVLAREAIGERLRELRHAEGITVKRIALRTRGITADPKLERKESAHVNTDYYLGVGLRGRRRVLR